MQLQSNHATSSIVLPHRRHWSCRAGAILNENVHGASAGLIWLGVLTVYGHSSDSEAKSGAASRPCHSHYLVAFKAPRRIVLQALGRLCPLQSTDPSLS